MKIRIKFEKYGSMKFIGHLDIMRYFQKCMRRADISITYTEGFSPHQVMSFASPLGVGITSSGEYLDIEVSASRSSHEALKALNEVMVDGVRVLEYKELPKEAKNAMSLVAAADYTVSFKEGYENPFLFGELQAVLRSYWKGQTEILITKQTKKSERTMDLKPLIYELLAVNKENPTIFLRLCAGSTDNIKPDLVLQSLCSYLNRKGLKEIEYDPMNLKVHRNEIYGISEDKFLPLGEFGKDIEEDLETC